MATILDGQGLTIEDVVRVARHGAKVELSAATKRESHSRAHQTMLLRSWSRWVKVWMC